MGLAESKPTAHLGASGRGEEGVDAIDVDAEVNRSLVELVERHFHDLSDSVLVKFEHGKGRDTKVLDDLSLRLIDVAETDVHDSVLLEFGDVLEPLEASNALRFDNAHQERHRHAVDVSTAGRFRGVDVSMGILWFR